jgi:glycosyltransferase involved in cell wall biosynthesis
LREFLQALVFELGLKDRFCLAGHIPDTIRSLGDINVFVMPSREEGLGTACIEAMLAGLPIVATSAGGLGELAGSAYSPIEPGSPEELARQIELLVDVPEEREKAGLRANERGQAFSADAMVAGTIDCYAQVTHRLPAPPGSAP